ncbi:MAG TPA: MurR/RpiR family transcriptional regulator [Acidimicrobiales bacterium]|nr:MurR/RpiR family transcriptional regulator [Acidimicrobiales bacterium]
MTEGTTPTTPDGAGSTAAGRAPSPSARTDGTATGSTGRDGAGIDGSGADGADTVGARIEAHRADLSPAERQVAEIVLRDPEIVAFGTVARVAERSGTSGASVVRLATRLGFPGFSGLQAAVQAAIGQQLRPAVERIRTEQGPDIVTPSLQVELDNVQRTLSAVDADAFAAAVGLLADRRRHVVVIAGDAENGVGAMFATALSLVRPGVSQVAGSDVTVARQLAAAGVDTVIVAIDLRRYERWVVDHVGRAVAAGATAIAVTDSLLSPLAAEAAVSFTVAAESAGVFDSHVGTLALTNLLVTGTARRLRRSATDRLDAVEAAWRAAGTLLDE